MVIDTSKAFKSGWGSVNSNIFENIVKWRDGISPGLITQCLSVGVKFYVYSMEGFDWEVNDITPGLSET